MSGKLCTLRIADRRGLRRCRDASAADGGLSHLAGRLPGTHAVGLSGLHTVIAEKYQAMVMLEQANSRMKDFFDLAVIAQRTELDGATLAAAIAATFTRRQTALPTERPLALTQQFSEDTAKLRQWQAFLNKNRIKAASLGDTVALLDDLLWPPTQVAAAGTQATATWRPDALRWV